MTIAITGRIADSVPRDTNVTDKGIIFKNCALFIE